VDPEVEQLLKIIASILAREKDAGAQAKGQ